MFFKLFFLSVNRPVVVSNMSILPFMPYSCDTTFSDSKIELLVEDCFVSTFLWAALPLIWGSA